MGHPPPGDAAQPDAHIATNFYGPHLLTLLLLPRLQRTARVHSRPTGGTGTGTGTAPAHQRGHRRRHHQTRVVNVTSCCHRWLGGGREQLQALDAGRPLAGRPHRFAAYAISKLAQMVATRALAERLRGSGVLVNAVHPGVVHTDMPRHLGRLSRLMNR